MRQVVVPGLVLPPTPCDLPAQDDQLSLGWLSPPITHRKLVPPGFQLGDLFLEAINVSSGVGLSRIEATGIQEQRGREPLTVQIQDHSRHKLAQPPVPSQDPPHLLGVGKWSDRNLNNEVENGVPCPVGLGNLTQGGGQDRSRLQVFDDWIRQGQPHLWLGPLFCQIPCSSGKRNAK